MISAFRLSPTMDRFLAARFLQPFVLALTTFTGIYLLADAFDRFDDLMRFGGLGQLGLLYFIFKLPLIVSQLLPVSCLAGVLIGFGMLNRSGEILAFQALGVSRSKLAAPVLAIAALIALFNFGLNELIVPFTTREARYIYTVQIKHRKLHGVFANRNIWMLVRGGFLLVDRYDEERERLEGITVFHMGPDFDLKDVHRSANARWDGSDWILAGAKVYAMDASGRVTSGVDHDLRLEAKPADFGLVRQDPEEFSLGELRRYIRGLRHKGLDPGRYLVDLNLKYAMPLACLVMAAVGTVLSLDPMPRHLSLGRSFAMGIGIGFGYWAVMGFTLSFGRSGLIPAWLAAWLPNLLFGIIAIAIFLFGEERAETSTASD
jgi:lipopolysaccharide export system permease protein